MHNIFIDGQIGTIGLRIAERLKTRKDLRLMEIPSESRKDSKIKKEFLNDADLVILCLHDVAARESVEMIENQRTRVIDASTAHRTNPDWVYGLPELNPNQRKNIRHSRRVCNPGCYPTGFLVAIAPLVASGLLPNDSPVTINAVSGYSGGGKKLIQTYESHSQNGQATNWSFRPYGLNLSHKHLPEMWLYSGLKYPPLFMPAVGNFYQGMLVSIPLVGRLLKKGTTASHIRSHLHDVYQNETFIRVRELNESEELDNGFLSPLGCVNTNLVDLFVFGDSSETLIIARLDNLGKGASGAAIQNMNIMLEIEEATGLSES